MDYPKTKDEWWQSINNNWENLKNLILNYYPNQKDFPKEGWPLNTDGKLASPQVACNVVIKSLRKEKPVWHDKGSFEQYLDELKKDQNPELDKILQASWFGMPESSDVRSLPCFFEFCDLCSESHVLYTEEN